MHVCNNFRDFRLTVLQMLMCAVMKESGATLRMVIRDNTFHYSLLLKTAISLLCLEFGYLLCRLKLFVGDKVTQYTGPRDLSSLSEFVEQQIQTKEVCYPP